MKIEWSTWQVANAVGHSASAGLVELNVTGDARGWTIGIYNADTSETFERVEGFAGTLDEAKQRAVALAMQHFEPFVSLARAAERAACLKIADDLVLSYEARVELPHAKSTPLWGMRAMQAGVAFEIANAIRARGAEDSKS